MVAKITGSIITCFLVLGACFTKAQTRTPVAKEKVNPGEVFTLATSQYKLLKKRLPAGRFPKTYYAANDSLGTNDSGWWCSGFYPGTLLKLYRQSKDTALLNAAQQAMELLKKEQYNTSTHDLGFMMYCSFGNALKTAPQQAYKQILINSARSLATRFDPRVGCIRSWNGKPGDFLVIIDNMMNLELLFWAARETGDSTFYNIAVTHANTTMKNHYRPDHSSYHVINYDAATGAVKHKGTAQGYADESAWARGQAWGLYGYTVMYRETRDRKYLAMANHIAAFMLDNPNLPADKIPYWDFNAPNIPNAWRDASAAAITASALLELAGYNKGPAADKYISNARQMLNTLSSPAYTAAPGTNGGFILMHSVGHLPAHNEVDVPLTYADYYYLEALERLQQLDK